MAAPNATPAEVEPVDADPTDAEVETNEADAGAAGDAAAGDDFQAAPQDPGEIVDRLRLMWGDFLELVPTLIIAIAALLLFAAAAKLASVFIRRLGKRVRVRRSLIDLFAQLAYIGIWVIGLLVAATIIFPTVTPGRLITGLGIGGIALGFAFKDIIENFIAGVLILWRFPVEIGDFIDCDGITGRVEEITVRSTLLRQVDGDLVIVPNSKLFLNPTNNLTNLPDKRITVIAGVSYDTDLEEARKVLREAVKSCDTVRKKPNRPIEIFAQEFADSSVNFEVTWWTGSTPLETRRSRDEVVREIHKQLGEAGIEIPFPYRTLTFKEPLPVVGVGAGAEGTEGQRD